MPKDYYAVLSVPRGATSQQIRERFLELVRERHPDRFSGREKERAERDFQEITEAFNVLGNPERRRLQDLELARVTTPANSPQPPEAVGRVYVQRGIRSFKEENFGDAVDNFDRATREEPQNAQSWYLLALACQQRNWLSRATAAASRACEIEPINPTYLKLAGQLFARAGSPDPATRYYERALHWGGEDEDIRQALEELGRSGKKGPRWRFGKAE